MSASDETYRLLQLLRDRHTPNEEWATFAELRGATGYDNPQRIDFFAVHLWPSKGFNSIAYEIKVSRNDFKKELDHPRKRAFAESVSHQCYFVTPSGLVQADEIPEGWGLMVADAGGLKIKKHALQRTDVKWPQSFMVSLARRV